MTKFYTPGHTETYCIYYYQDIFCCNSTDQVCPVLTFVLQSVRLAAIVTISQLLNASAADSTEENAATLR